MKILKAIWFLVLLAGVGCNTNPQELTPPPDRESLIPPEQIKIIPETDTYIPRSLTDEYTDPVPLPYPINTAGAEDSAFVLPDGKALYVWFTPNVKNPPEQQVIDGVTGIYVFRKVNGGWGPAERVLLQDSGKLSLDGCEFVMGNKIWFCAAREGYTGLHWFTAEFIDGRWGNWELADFKPDYQVGELHITSDGQELYFHSPRTGGKGGYDLWLSENVNGDWGEPINLANLNSADADGWPFVSPDGSELWFTRQAGSPELWRSKRTEDGWDEPERMFAPFAGEASMDETGNLYFTHHFFKDNNMLEADIYIASPSPGY